MSDELRVACPHCGSKFRLKNRQSLGRKMTCRNCGDEFTARTSTGDDEFAAADLLPPAPTRRSSGGSRRKKSARWRMNRWGFAAAAFVVAAGLGIAFSGPLSRFFGEVRQIGGKINPLADSPQKVMNDLMALRREIKDAIKSVHDEGSRDAAVPRFKDLRGRTDDLVLRASRMEVLSEAEIRALLEPHMQEIMSDLFPNLSGEGRQQAPVPGSALVSTPEYRTALGELRLSFSLASESILDGLKPLPEPQNEGERLICDAAEMSRQVVRRLANASSVSDLEKVASEVASRVSKMKQLVARAKGLASDEVGTRRQKGLRMAGAQAKKQCDVVIGYLENRIGKHPALRQALDDLAKEETNLEVAVHAAEAQARLQAAQARAGQPALPRPPPTGLPGLPPGGTTPGLGNLPSSPQAMRDNFLKRHGPDGVLTVKAMKYPGDKQTELSQQLREITGATELFAMTEDGATTVLVACAGDVGEISRRIDFGKVTAIDAKARTITIEPREPASGAKK